MFTSDTSSECADDMGRSLSCDPWRIGTDGKRCGPFGEDEFSSRLSFSPRSSCWLAAKLAFKSFISLFDLAVPAKSICACFCMSAMRCKALSLSSSTTLSLRSSWRYFARQSIGCVCITKLTRYARPLPMKFSRRRKHRELYQLSFLACWFPPPIGENNNNLTHCFGHRPS